MLVEQQCRSERVCFIWPRSFDGNARPPSAACARRSFISGKIVLTISTMLSTRLPSVLTILFAYLPLAFCLLTSRITCAELRPNVVVLLADDLGSKDIGCYGGPVRTPALDRLANNGVKFTSFYSAAPVCSTARASLLTGRHHLRTGVYTVIQDHIHDMHLLRKEVTIAEVLKANGYDTVHLGKWHLGTPFRGLNKPWIDEHGFDYWFATDLNAAPSHRNPVNFWRNRERVGALNGYACQLVVDEAISWLDQKRDAARPFFLNVWFHEPHAPLAAPEEIVAQYGQLSDPAAIYSATIDNTDRAIARLLKKLEQIGVLDDTIIIYTSDHGSYRQERNGILRGGKGALTEGGLRTPGIVHWPNRIKGGRIQDTPASALDLLPTICGLAKIRQPEGVHIDGADLTSLLIGDPSDFKRAQPLTWHSPTSQPVVAIRDGKYSLIGFRKNEYPKDTGAIHEVMESMRVIIEQHLGRPLNRNQLWHECYNNPLKSPEWRKLRARFVSLNTFQEAWIPLIKSGFGEVSRFELHDLSNDPEQKQNIANRFPQVVNRLRQTVLEIHGDVLDEAPVWGTVTAKENRLGIHRFDSPKRSIFDAFAYVNRIPVDAESGELPEDLASRILSRLANQEGRILVKLPLGMNQTAYEGFKAALGSTGATDTCFACHQLPEFGNAKSAPPIPSLRNRSYSTERLQNLLQDDTHKKLLVGQTTATKLQAFLQTLTDVPDAKFRDLILKATVLDFSGDHQ